MLLRPSSADQTTAPARPAASSPAARRSLRWSSTSAFNALSFSPMLSGLILPKEEPKPPRGPVWIGVGVIVGLAFGRFSAASFGSWTYILGVVIGVLAGANLPLIFKAFNNGFDRLQKGYVRLLKRLIALRRLILAGLGVGIVL